MKKFLFLLCMMMGSVYADTSAPLTGNWNNVITGTHPNNCCTGGPAPLYDPSTNTIHFSYGLTAVHRVIAINQALSGTGIQINGYNWGYDLRNMNGVAGGQGGTDSITATTFMTNSSGQIITQDDRTYNTQFDWTRFSGTVNLSSALSLQNAGSLGIQFVSMDSGFWAGYYGPQVRNVEMTVNYTVDQCSADPLSSTSCPGYEAAYLNMQCSANSLYSSSCPGYAQAYYTQQCSINPLFDSGCPGYQQAYYTQQCTANPLYDVGCPGYEQAYFNQQCSIDALYNEQCPGYAVAYLNYQCSLDALYSTTCSGYNEAYALKYVVNKPVETTSTTTQAEPTTVAMVSDPVVNNTLTTTATSASPAQTATATVPLVAAPATAAPSQQKPKEQQAASNTTQSSQDKKEQPKNARQALAEKRQAEARAAAKEKQNESQKELENATSLQAQIAVQNVVLQAMGYLPGFDAYQTTMKDGVGYKPYSIYNNQANTDNARAQRMLSGASDRLHQEMVNEQYKQ